MTTAQKTAASGAKPPVDKSTAVPRPTEAAKSVPKPKPARRPSVLMVAAEGMPFAKTGGLADVVGALPKALIAQGLDVRVMMPFHHAIKQKYAGKVRHLCSFSVDIGWRSQFVGVEQLVCDGVTYYFIDNEYYFGDAVYRGGQPEIEQYAYFSRAVIDSIPMLGFTPDILHVNDWHTAMIPMLLKTQYSGAPQGGIRTMLTIHNLMYQGQCGFEQMSDLLSIPERYNTPEYLENYGCASFLKAGCVFADLLSTVSPTYAREIRTETYGCGLSGILNARSHELLGIVNGIDNSSFDPSADAALPCGYDADELSGKSRVKEALSLELGLQTDGVPLVSMVTRLTQQKGMDLVVRMIDELVDCGIVFAILGTGDTVYQDFLRGAEQRHKGRVCAYIGYSDALSRRIYAGSDLFLMPSLFEPCGISQMIAMRYGTLPIVRETGGLKDTVQPYNMYSGDGNGFSFANYNAHEMKDAVLRAADVYNDTDTFAALVKNAMRTDFSFDKSAGEYVRAFEKLL